MYKNQPNKFKTNFLYYIFVAVGSMIVGYFAYPKINHKIVTGVTHPIRESTYDYTYISPLLAYETQSEVTEQSKILSAKINKYISQNKDGEDKISVYYRDLNTGDWVGINDNDKYSPASMLKVIIMIGYLKRAENNPSLLSNKFTYTLDFKKVLDDKPFDSQTELKVGVSYKVNYLLDRMIIDSDNGAKDLLLSNIDDDFLNSVYTDLGLRGPDMTTEYLISPRDYSLFFRVLYNATYLNREMSELALATLSRAIYANGIRAKVPENIKIAHKFGEHVENEGNSIKSVELHDCGIVYDPGKPYFLCIMTHGQEVSILEKYIQNISDIVFTQVESD